VQSKWHWAFSEENFKVENKLTPKMLYLLEPAEPTGCNPSQFKLALSKSRISMDIPKTRGSSSFSIIRNYHFRIIYI
jgi:hypothetical protein